MGTIRMKLTGKTPQGFALIATVSVMSLLLVVFVGILSFASIEVRQTHNSSHQEMARANARLALMIALGELQKHAGPDQRVTARAAILENPGEQSLIANRNWVGVWTTTHEFGKRSWPVIGKAPSGGGNDSPYSRPGAYEDLRYTDTALAGGAWREALRQVWLVSHRGSTVDVGKELSTSDDKVVEILGRGTLGDGRGHGASEYHANRVLVEKVPVGSAAPLGAGKEGAYAWYIGDNNQKASIDPLAEVHFVNAAFEASPRSNPALIKSNGRMPFFNFTKEAEKSRGKLVTYQTASLTQSDPDSVKDWLGEYYHHLTTYSPGLFTDTLGGGLRQDLTPLLLANKGDKIIDFSFGEGAGYRKFSSSYPIIPGSNHGVLGPSFGALRNWTQHAYTDLAEAETSFASSATRTRPTEFWPHRISDGVCADASEWAESAPKIHPVMTDCRWHYYFSHHNKRIRTHIIPRVCLWNPYNRKLRIPEMSVLMPNPFYRLSHGMHFFPEASHVNELKNKYKNDAAHVFTRWIQKGGYAGGSVYKMRMNPFPTERYLAFTLESTTLGAGECHVFSPKVITTTPDLSSSGIRIQRYQPMEVSANVLSSSSPQGADHFYFDHSSSVKYQVQATSWRSLGVTELNELDFGRIFDYQPEVSMQSDGKVESFPFALKAGSSSSLAALYSSVNHPTLQLINNGAGGVKPTTFFGYIGKTWGSANQQDNSFGYLQTFAEAPLKDAPDTHQVGAKMIWFDEDGTEANDPPLRVNRWTRDHMVYNVSSIANWNVRAQLTTRSPVSQCAQKWYMTSAGPWLLQFLPHSPQDVNDQPSLSGEGKLIKNPFGAAVHFPFTQGVTLFDLPSEDYGVLSMARLRHAMLSPYSWHPSYIVGHSLRDMHAPDTHTAHDIAVSPYSRTHPVTRWDYLIGGSKGSGLSHGPYASQIDSQGLLQIGNQAVTRSVDGTLLSSEDEVLAYDIAYEVNHNLWDRFFISGMPLAQNTESFDWAVAKGRPLWNRRYQYNSSSGLSKSQAEARVSGEDGLNAAFWRNAELLKNRAAFNVNSTSVEAWTAFLACTLGIKRPLKSGELGEDDISFARYHRPAGAVDTSNADPRQAGAWLGGRKLSHDELRMLAEKVVEEVKKRGPFVSVSDFVNRRLTDVRDESSHMGTLDAAIKAAGLNREFERNPFYQTTAVNVGTYTDAPDNNLSNFKHSYRYRSEGGSFTTVQPASQAWGLPGFLTQGDLLDPLAPSIAVRGDTFTIRTYGESAENGEIKARAWLQVTVERTPRYVDDQVEGAADAGGNDPTDMGLIQQQATGQYLEGSLNNVNKKYGRKFIIKSFRWLVSQEV